MCPAWKALSTHKHVRFRSYKRPERMLMKHLQMQFGPGIVENKPKHARAAEFYIYTMWYVSRLSRKLKKVCSVC